jgi:molybdopterin synthase sulfur carrier subunit
MEDGEVACNVRIPAPLQAFTGGAKTVEVQETTVRSLLKELGVRYEGLYDRICRGDGELKGFVNVYVNDVDIRSLDGLDTSIAEGDEIILVPAIAGG